MKKKISILGGSGHVGMPLGLKFAQKGYYVAAIDKNKRLNNLLNSGIVPYKEVNAKKYICGYGAENYLDFEKFANDNVEIGFLNSKNPIYKQFHGDFIPDLSILDMLMNVDRDNIKEYLLQKVTIESRI